MGVWGLGFWAPAFKESRVSGLGFRGPRVLGLRISGCEELVLRAERVFKKALYGLNMLCSASRRGAEALPGLPFDLKKALHGLGFRV